MSSNHLILCSPLLLLPSIFPSIRVFSNELAFRIGWPKYWHLLGPAIRSQGHPCTSSTQAWHSITLSLPQLQLPDQPITFAEELGIWSAGLLSHSLSPSWHQCVPLVTLTVLWPLLQLLSPLSQSNIWFKWLHHRELLQLQNLNFSLWQQLPIFTISTPFKSSTCFTFPPVPRILASFSACLVIYYNLTISTALPFYVSLPFLCQTHLITSSILNQAKAVFSCSCSLPVLRVKEETHKTVPTRSLIKIYNLCNPWNSLSCFLTPYLSPPQLLLPDSSVTKKEVSLLFWVYWVYYVLDTMYVYSWLLWD